MNGHQTLKAEPWPVHLLGLINPLLVITGNLLGGAYTLMGLVFVWLLCPMLDLALGESKVTRPPRSSSLPFTAILWTHGLLHFVMLASFVWFVLHSGMHWWLVSASLSCGLAAATSAIVTAHELGHHRPKSPGWWLAHAMLHSILYGHYTTEHNRNHHKHVATAADPASARASQSLWAFWPASIAGQFVSAQRIHAKKGKTGLRNPVLQGLGLQLLAFALLLSAHLYGQAWAAPLALGWFTLSALAILTLEYVNYIRHWGLRRHGDAHKFQAAHAWNTEARWSRWSLLELTRHSDHHLRASQPFWRLKAHPQAPSLPAGYYACWWPCLIPPLWRRLMAGRAPGL